MPAWPTTLEAIWEDMALKRERLGPKSKRLLPAYSSSWRMVGDPKMSVLTSRDPVTIFCERHNATLTTTARDLLNTSLSDLAAPCLACQVEDRRSRGEVCRSRTWPMVMELFGGSREWEFVEIASVEPINRLGIAGAKDRARARCIKPRSDGSGKCGREVDHVVSAWVQVLSGSAPRQLLCQGACDSKDKGKARRLTAEEQERRLIEARAGTWTRPKDSQWRGLGEKQVFVHSCGFEVSRIGNTLIEYPVKSGKPPDTPDDCLACSRSLEWRAMGDDVDLVRRLLARMTGGRIKFTGTSVPAIGHGSDERFVPVECMVCGSSYKASVRHLQSSVHAGCEVCTENSARAPRAWVLAEAESVLARRQCMFVDAPDSYETPVGIRFLDGTIKTLSVLELVREMPLRIGDPAKREPAAASRDHHPYSRRDIQVIRSMTAARCAHWVDIARQLQRSPGSVKRFAQRHRLRNDWDGVRIIHPSWDGAFSQVTEDSAFLAGLLASDGCVGGARGRISIEVKAFDEILLLEVMRYLRLRKALGYRITGSQGGSRGLYVSLSWRNERHLHDLAESFGVVPRKTYTLCPPEFDDLEHSLAYLSGLLAGDGYVRCDPAVHALRINLVTAAPECHAWVVRLYQRLGLKFSVRRPDHSPRSYSIDMNGNDACMLARRIVQIRFAREGLPRKWAAVADLAGRGAAH